MQNLNDLIESIRKFLDSQTNADWWTNNISWFIPLVVSVVFSLLAIWLSFRNTKKQNADNHRPYLTIKSLIQTEPTSDGYIIICNESGKEIELHEYGNPKFSIGCNLTIKNIGYGIASIVKMIGIKKSYSVAEAWNDSAKTANILSVLDMGIDDENKLSISIYDYNDFDFYKNSSDTELTVHLLLFYSDLYGDIFSSMLILSANRLNKTITYTCYPEKSSHFKHMLYKLKLNYKQLKNRYSVYSTRTKYRKSKR